MQVRFNSPRNPLEWLLAILVFGVVIALGFMLMGVVIVVVAVAIVAAPVVGWWRRKKGVTPPAVSHPSPDPTPMDDLDDLDDLDGPIVDAEYEVKGEE